MLRGNPRRRRREAIVRTLFFLAAALSIVVSVAIVLSVVIDAVEFLRAIDLNQLWADGWFPRRGRFSIPTIFVGSLMITSGGAGCGAAPRLGRRYLPLGVRPSRSAEERSNRRSRSLPGSQVSSLGSSPSPLSRRTSCRPYGRTPRFSTMAPPGSPSASSSSPSSHRSPRMPCVPCLSRSARPPMGSAPSGGTPACGSSSRLPFPESSPQ